MLEKGVKFKCDGCGLMFHAVDLKSVLACDKHCIPCKRSKELLTDMELHNMKISNDGKTTCKRCGTTYKNSVTKCVHCDCIELIGD